MLNNVEVYGKSLMPEGYKFKLYFILFLIVLPLYAYLIISVFDFLFITLISIILISIIIAIESEPIAFENGIRTRNSTFSVIGFVPYEKIVYMCSVRHFNSISLLIITRGVKFTKKPSFGIADNKRTPFNAVIPCMKKHISNWDEVYHPEIIIYMDEIEKLLNEFKD